MMFWLVYRRGSKTEIVIQPAAHVIMARMKLAIAGYKGDYLECHQLDRKTARKIPEKFIGKPLSRKQADDLLTKL
jgi:hypothetical protein